MTKWTWTLEDVEYALRVANLPVLEVRPVTESGCDPEIRVAENTYVTVAQDGKYAYLTHVRPGRPLLLGRRANDMADLLYLVRKELHRNAD
jgi:hypothetical protein